VWATWWLGDSIGVLLVTPLILILFTTKHNRVSQVAFNAINVTIVLGIFLGSVAIFSIKLPVMYLLTMSLFLAAFRLTQLGLVMINILIATIAIYATLMQQGPLSNYKPEASLLMLQLFIAVNVIASLLFWSNTRRIRLLGMNLTQEKFIAREDKLTGILNRRGFEDLASEKIKQLSQGDKSAYFVMFDIDNFKMINDSYGHPFGDKVLRMVTQCVSLCIRKQDVFGRIGGEEFALLLLDSESDQALTLSERIRRAVSEIDFPEIQKEPPKITISIGITLLADSEQLYKTFDRADKLLYEAKRSGKNRVVMG